MQVQRQPRRSLGPILVLMLALAAAAMLGGSAGYQLRATGFPHSGSATVVSRPVAPAPHYYEPDAGDRRNATTAPTPAAEGPDRIPTSGFIP